MDQLPVRFNPAELARAGRAAQITLPVSHFSRFAAILADDSGDVAIEVKFSWNDDGQIVATGSLSSQVKVTCQRCQQIMTTSLSSPFSLVCVATESDATELAEHLDPVVIGNGEDIGIVEFIEDELILQVPTRLVHEDESDCDPTIIAALAGEQQTPTDTHNPFKGLDKLLKD